MNKSLLVISFIVKMSLMHAMELPEPADQIKFTTKEGREIRCQLLSAITDAVTGIDSDPSMFVEDEIDPELLQASPQSFVKLARMKFQEYIDEQLESHGVTPTKVAFNMGKAKKMVNERIKQATYHAPTGCLEKEIEEVAEELGLPKPVLKKHRTGDAMKARANVVEYDPVPMRDFAPTPKRRKAGWAHELFHNANQDTERRVARCLAFEALHKEEVYAGLKGHIDRVDETFADLGSEGHSREYAVNMQRLWKRQIRKNRNPVANSHPTDRHRLRIAECMVKFHDIYETEQALKKAQSDAGIQNKENHVRKLNSDLLQEFKPAEKLQKSKR